MYCSYCTDQVKSSTMRERMAAARMISTLVSRPAEEAGQGADLRHISSQSLLSPHHPSPGVLVLGRHQPAGALALAAHGLLGQEAPAEVRRSHGGCQLALGSAHLRIFTSRLSSHRQVMPSSYGAHRWTMAARPPGSDD